MTADQYIDNSGTRIRAALLSLAFVAAMWLPLLKQTLDGAAETASPAEAVTDSIPAVNWSRASIRAFPRAFDDYYGSHFGFRNTLIRGYGAVMLFGLGVSPSDRVVVGKNGWYFYSGRVLRNENPIADFTRETPLNDSQLKQWCEILRRRHDWLNARGVRYIVMLVPNKAEIYPEYVPESVRQGDAQSTVEQFAGYVRANTDIRVLDLTRPLLDAKPWVRLYHQTDTHWNDCGGFVGYGELVASLHPWFPSMKAAPVEAFEVRQVPSTEGELIRFMNLEGVVEAEHVFSLHPLRPGRAAFSLVEEPEWRYTGDTGDVDLPRAVIYGDSFLGPLAPRLSEHFERSVYCFSYSRFPIEVIEAEHPDVVVEEILQRFLRDDVVNPPDVAAFRNQDEPKL